MTDCLLKMLGHTMKGETMDPKQCLIDVEKLVNKARALRVHDSETHAKKIAVFEEARDLLKDYYAWRSNGGFEPKFPTFQGGKEDIPGDMWAKHFSQVLRSFGISL